jgi:hypothetical protein
MCEAGLLTEEQLEHALSVQESTGRPLGEVIVTLGYASPGAVANALAEQYGGTLRTEYGVSAGLGRPRSDQQVSPLRPAQGASGPAGQPGDAAADEAAREAQLAGMGERARAAEAKVEELEARLAELDSELGASRQAVADLTARLQGAPEPEELPEEPPGEEREHLLFVPSDIGYAVVRRAGACPPAGSVLEDVEGRSFVVARIGSSPLGDRLRCAYLEPAR